MLSHSSLQARCSLLFDSRFLLILKINYINPFVFEWDLLQVLLGKPASVAVIVLSIMACQIISNGRINLNEMNCS